MTQCSCEDKVITIEELADYIKVSRPILYKGVRDNTLGIPCIKINKTVRFFKSDVDAWIDMHRKNTGPAVATKCGE